MEIDSGCRALGRRVYCSAVFVAKEKFWVQRKLRARLEKKPGSPLYHRVRAVK